MKSGVTLQQMLTEVKRQSESKEDYLIAPNRLRMESYGKEMFLHLSDDSGTELIEPMTITGIAHRQIGTHLRIPAAYYDRMREERPDLLAYNANTWFKQESSQRMLRTLDGSARAYLSNRYRRIFCAKSLLTRLSPQRPPLHRKSMCRPGILSSAAEMRMTMKKISDWAKALLPLVGSGMVLHYLFLWHERRHAVALHKEVYHNPHH